MRSISVYSYANKKLNFLGKGLREHMPLIVLPFGRTVHSAGTLTWRKAADPTYRLVQVRRNHSHSLSQLSQYALDFLPIRMSLWTWLTIRRIPKTFFFFFFYNYKIIEKSFVNKIKLICLEILQFDLETLTLGRKMFLQLNFIRNC